ncbi:MAG: isochorismatase family cysteine hydrolase, partial [Myxococcota bacterium]
MGGEPQDDHAFSGRLGFGDRPAVVVVDMCQAYFTAGSPLFIDRPGVADRCLELVEAARATDCPIWWTRVLIPAHSRSVFRRKVPALATLAPGHPLADWLPKLTPLADEPVVTKQSASAFFGTDLVEQLKTRDIDTVVLAGVSTSGCVRATALDACQHDLVPIGAVAAGFGHHDG